MTLAPLDESSRPKVILSKSLYNQGALRVRQITGLPDRLMAVIAFDWSIETVLKAAILQIDQSKQGKDLSGDLITKCRQVLVPHNKPLPNEGLIGRVRNIRNAAQHEARIPNDSELTDCRAWTYSFLDDFVRLIWGIDFERLSITDLIRDEEIRSLLVQGEKLLEQGDIRQGAGSAMGAVQNALRKVQTAIVGRKVDDISVDSGKSIFEQSGSEITSQTRESIQKAIDILQTSVNKTQEVALFGAFGLDYTTFLKMRLKVGDVLVSANNTVRVTTSESTGELDSHEAAVIVSWCADLVLQIENRVGDFKSPFGVNYWP